MVSIKSHLHIYLFFVVGLAKICCSLVTKLHFGDCLPSYLQVSVRNLVYDS